MKWEKKTIGDLVTLQRGYDLPESERIQGDIPIIGSAGITGYHNEAKAKGPCVTMGRSGNSIGKITFIKDDFWPHNACLYVKDLKNNDIRFSYYILNTIDFKGLNSGGAIPSLNRNLVYPTSINLPPLPTQRKIASILSAYDDLFENNLKRIKLLEEKAPLHYKEILTTEKTEKIKLEEVVRVIKGRKPKDVLEVEEENCILYLLLDTVERTKSVFTSDLSMPMANSDDVLMCMDGARSGLSFRGMVGAVGSTMAVWRATDERISGEYLYQFLKENESSITQGNTGAAIPHANRKFILEMKIPIIEKKQLREFSEITKPINSLIRNLHQQNTKLREARDILLPRLMSGEIEV